MSDRRGERRARGPRTGIRVTRVHVTGAAGYAAAEAIRLLHGHPHLELGVLESRSNAGEELADHFALLRSTPYRFAPPGSVAAAVRPGDVVMVAAKDRAQDVKRFVGRLKDSGRTEHVSHRNGNQPTIANT